MQRFDVDCDLPEAFLPGFPPAISLPIRLEFGDVSHGEVVSINNFDRLFRSLIPPMELDGLRLLLTPMPQEEFSATNDRKSLQPSLGVACFDCHINGHATGQFDLNPDMRPEQRRLRLDTPSLRGVFAQLIHGSKRSIRSVRDFSQFEQPRSAYFNGDMMCAEKKGVRMIAPEEAVRMERFQNMLDFPPAPKLNLLGRLDPAKATKSELHGEQVFFGKGQCAACHPAPYYLDNQMHDLHLERFVQEPGDGPVKAFTLRGIKESPPYFHDGRLLTLEDTVEFFNLVLGVQLTPDEKADLVAFCDNFDRLVTREKEGGAASATLLFPCAIATNLKPPGNPGRVRTRAGHLSSSRNLPCPASTTWDLDLWLTRPSFPHGPGIPVTRPQAVVP